MADNENVKPTTSSYDLEIGKDCFLHNKNTAVRIVIRLDDGTEFECQMGPNDTVRFRRGVASPVIEMFPSDVSVSDPLKVVKD